MPFYKCFSSFPFLCRPGLDFLLANRVFFFKKKKALHACPTSAPGPCSHFLVESELLDCFCLPVRIIWVILCSML